MKLAAVPAILSLIAAAPPAAAPPSQLSLAKGFSDRLAGLTDIQRKGAVRRAILDNGQFCRTVEGVAYQGPYKNLEMWVARCGPKPVFDYGLFIGPDGTVQVSQCAYLLKVKWPACRPLPSSD